MQELLVIVGDDVAAPFIAALHGHGDVGAGGAASELALEKGGGGGIDGAIQQVEIEGVEERGVGAAALRREVFGRSEDRSAALGERVGLEEVGEGRGLGGAGRAGQKIVVKLVSANVKVF